MKQHKEHLDKVLGHYCFVCKVKTRAGIPGWVKLSRGPLVGRSVWASNTYGGFCTSIVWLNGDETKKEQPCALCLKYCGNPVERTFLTDNDGYPSRVKNLLN